MNNEFIATCFHYGGQVVSYLLKNRPPKRKKLPAYPVVEDIPTVEDGISQEIPQGLSAEENTLPEEDGASSVKAGCVPCAIGHISTCSGGLAEAMRFARQEGIASNAVIDRIGHCLEELNGMEREDLSPQKIASLPPWEKDLAVMALNVSRQMRHRLEGMEASSTVKDLETIAAWAQESRQEIVRGWFKNKLNKKSDNEKAEFAKQAIAKLEEE